MPDKFVILVAGGAGVRMGTYTPKQFLPIDNTPIIVHTVRAFERAVVDVRIIVVLPKDQLVQWQSIKAQFLDDIILDETIGGATRYDSVKAGLSLLKNKSGLVAIHDAVRPCINDAIIRKSFEVANESGSAIVAVNLKDSVREIVSDDRSIARDRTKYKLVQTPQTFDISKIISAYNHPYLDSFTDDASVYEQYIGAVKLIEGDYRNIKVTTPEDLAIAAAFLSNMAVK